MGSSLFVQARPSPSPAIHELHPRSIRDYAVDRGSLVVAAALSGGGRPRCGSHACVLCANRPLACGEALVPLRRTPIFGPDRMWSGRTGERLGQVSPASDEDGTPGRRLAYQSRHGVYCVRPQSFVHEHWNNDPDSARSSLPPLPFLPPLQLRSGSG